MTELTEMFQRVVDAKIDGAIWICKQGDCVRDCDSRPCLTEKRILAERRTEEEINRILDYKDDAGGPVDVFDLHVVVCVGTCETVSYCNAATGRATSMKRIWDVARFSKWMTQDVSLDLGQFEDCETEEDVREAATDLINRRIAEELGIEAK